MAQSTAQSGPPELADELKNLLSRNIEGNLQLLGRLSNLARETAKSVNTSGQPQPPGILVGRLVKLNLSYLSLITKHGLAFADEMVTITARALGVTAAPSAGAATTGDQPRAEIQLSAHIGETATATFLVENSRLEALNVSFEASQILSRQGEPIKSPLVRFKPSRLQIKPGGQSTVQALIKVSSEFKADELYFLRVRLLGFEEKEILIALQVLPPQKAVSPDAAAGSKRNKTKRRRPSKRAAK